MIEPKGENIRLREQSSTVTRREGAPIRKSKVADSRACMKHVHRKEGLLKMNTFMNISNRDEAVRARAYQIWESEGCPAGKDFDHWTRSEMELRQEAAPVVSEPDAKRKSARRAKPKAKKATAQ